MPSSTTHNNTGAAKKKIETWPAGISPGCSALLRRNACPHNALAAQRQAGDGPAKTFALSLYDYLLSGDTVAEAVRKARLTARQQGDPTWLAYSVYAHPNARVVSVNR